MPQKYTAAIGANEYPVSSQDLLDSDIISTGQNQFHLIKNGTSYNCELLSIQPAVKQLTVSVNGKIHRVKLADEYDQLVKQLGLSAVVTQQNKDVIAPMPGLVLDIMVAVGDEVSAGTPLLILEAMKMENVIKAEGDGTIKAIAVDKGAAVEKRQLLIEVE